jgi:sugar/nucleoside kinase (ribokinase family)
VVAGNVDQDLAPDGSWVPGGPALYAARMALSLGARVDLITRLTDDYDRSVLDGIHVVAIEAEQCCRYANAYDANGDRTQILLAEGDPINPSFIGVSGANAYMLAPAYHEFAAMPNLQATVVAVSLQGPLRTTDAGGKVVHHPDPFGQADPFIAPGTLAFFSEEDTADAPALARHIGAIGGIALLTRGYRGAVMFDGANERSFTAIPATSLDPTGAGDCFAMAFVVRMVETDDLGEACRFALAAGSLAVEAQGVAGIPSREAVERRLEGVAA